MKNKAKARRITAPTWVQSYKKQSTAIPMRFRFIVTYTDNYRR